MLLYHRNKLIDNTGLVSIELRRALNKGKDDGHGLENRDYGRMDPPR
jgi:hypothetical protein